MEEWVRTSRTVTFVQLGCGFIDIIEIGIGYHMKIVENGFIVILIVWHNLKIKTMERKSYQFKHRIMWRKVSIFWCKCSHYIDWIIKIYGIIALQKKTNSSIWRFLGNSIKRCQCQNYWFSVLNENYLSEPSVVSKSI